MGGKTSIVIVKLGGSVITDKNRPFTARPRQIRRLSQEIHSARMARPMSLIVAHGGGSFPHTPAKRYEIHEGIVGSESYRGISLVQDAASRLNRIVVGELLNSGENALSIQPSAGALARNSRIIRWDIGIVRKALESNLVPVPYGDVALDVERGCCILSTEEIIRYLCTRLPVERVIIGSNVNGVYDRDPHRFSDAKKIPIITLKDYRQALLSAGRSAGIDVTGGMKSKVLSLLEIVREKRKVECEILDITVPGALERALTGERQGTVIKAR